MFRRKKSAEVKRPVSRRGINHVAKEFDDAVETITKHADSGALPQIYDPLKTCFEVLKPFHLTDLELETDFDSEEKSEVNNQTQDEDDFHSQTNESRSSFDPWSKLEVKAISCNSDTESESKGSKSETSKNISVEEIFNSSEDEVLSPRSGAGDMSTRKSTRSSKLEKSVCSVSKKTIKSEVSSDSESQESEKSPRKLSESEITHELKLADEKASRTVMMIDQIREAIATYQAKEVMTDEDIEELKRNQRRLAKNLNQLEKITAKVKNLVGCADKSFKRKWDKMELDQVEKEIPDMQGGGDIGQITADNQKEYEKIIPKEEPIQIDEIRQLQDERMMEEKESNKSDDNMHTARKEEEDSEQEDREEKDSDEEEKESDENIFIQSDIFKFEREPDNKSIADTVSRISFCPSFNKLAAASSVSVPPLDNVSHLQTATNTVETDKSVPEVMLSLTGRLCESYTMQEKLAAENADLEGFRYQLQEELITKENAVEHLQRKVANLQAEMRLIVRENSQLNDKINNSVGGTDVKMKVTPGGGDEVEGKMRNYKEKTRTLETMLKSLEREVKTIQEELDGVKKEREDLENHRRAMKISMSVSKRSMGNHGGLLSPLPPRDSNTELQLKELRTQYDYLEQDYKNKVLDVASLRAGNDKLVEITDKAREERDFMETQCKSYERRLKELEMEKSKMLGSKEQLMESEQQISVLKMKYREAKDEIDELKSTCEDQGTQLEEYRNKYLAAQQQVEEQLRQIDHMEIETQRITDECQSEIQRMKQQCQDKIAELSPLPDLLKETQIKLQEAQQLRMIAERNYEDLQQKTHELSRKLENERSSSQLGLDERNQMTSKMESWENKCNEIRDENAQLKTTVARLEEAASQNERRLDEKLHEVAQLSSQMEMLREESARQVTRSKDRAENVKRTLQNQIADLERQLAQSRATARTCQKDKDEIRQRMQAQINNLNDNFEQAQLRIKSLQSHVNFLKNSYSGMFSPEPSNITLMESPSQTTYQHQQSQQVDQHIPPPCNPCDCTFQY